MSSHLHYRPVIAIIAQMAKEVLVLASIAKPDFEKVDGDVFYASLPIKKGTGEDWRRRFQKAAQEGETANLHFPAHLGYRLEAPIVSLNATEYDETFPYDVLDILPPDPGATGPNHPPGDQHRIRLLNHQPQILSLPHPDHILARV